MLRSRKTTLHFFFFKPRRSIFFSNEQHITTLRSLGAAQCAHTGFAASQVSCGQTIGRQSGSRTGDLCNTTAEQPAGMRSHERRSRWVGTGVIGASKQKVTRPRPQDTHRQASCTHTYEYIHAHKLQVEQLVS